MSDSSKRSPLDGIVVIDVGQVYQGPYATFLMAKAGARVIKVEPIDGEILRHRSKVDLGSALPFAMLNANKEGVALDLKSDEGRDVFLQMIAKADVLLENFAPGVMDRLKIGCDVVQQINPRLIYATGTGFGISGPDTNNLAMDLTIQATSGLMSVTGFPDGPPLKAGASIVDFLGGVHLFGGVMMALYERSVTGLGRLVEVSMQESVVPTLVSNIGRTFRATQLENPRTGNRHGGMSVTPYNVYRASDGYVAVLSATEKHWQSLLTAMGREDLLGDPRYEGNPARVEHMDEVDSLIEQWTSSLPVKDIADIAKKHRLLVAPVRELDEVMNDAHMHARGALEWMDHPDFGRIVVPNSPIRIHGAERVTTRQNPKLGEHRTEVLCDWLGLSEGRIAELQASKAIG